MNKLTFLFLSFSHLFAISWISLMLILQKKPRSEPTSWRIQFPRRWRCQTACALCQSLGITSRAGTLSEACERKHEKTMYSVRCTMLYNSVQYLLHPVTTVPWYTSWAQQWRQLQLEFLYNPVPSCSDLYSKNQISHRLQAHRDHHVLSSSHGRWSSYVCTIVRCSLFKAWIITNASWDKCQGNPDLIRS